MRRLGITRQAQELAASAQFDLARSPLSDDQLEEVTNGFGARPSTDRGFSEGLQDLLSKKPKSVPISDLTALQQNLIRQGYASPDTEPNGVWDPLWYASFRRFDRDAYEAQRSGHHWLATVEVGTKMITNTSPLSCLPGDRRAAKGTVMQTPETFKRGCLVGGAAAGAGIGLPSGQPCRGRAPLRALWPAPSWAARPASGPTPTNTT
jgi:hypothetical protein